jgi:hypothetical protein
MRRVIINTCIAGENETLNAGQIVNLNDERAARLVEKGFATYVELSKEEVEKQRKIELLNSKDFQALEAKYDQTLKENETLKTALAAAETKTAEAIKKNENLKAELAEIKKGK